MYPPAASSAILTLECYPLYGHTIDGLLYLFPSFPSCRRVAILPIVFAVADYMVAMRAEGQPKPLKVEARPDGQLVATVGRVWL